ncbi:ribonuclease R [Mycoplasmatota bacterium]|nr:ribonuclease R [Mycoplasmatota bacterium]
MKNIYLLFYEQQTRKLHKDLTGEVDLTQYPYIVYEEPFYKLKSFILIGRLDRKASFGFLRQEVEDVYIDKDGLIDAMHDDIVLLDISKNAKIVQIVERALKTIVATIKKRKNGIKYFTDVYLDKRLDVEPYDHLVQGHVVMLEVLHITKQKIFAKVDHIIGHVNDPDIETLKIVSSYNWPTEFDSELLDSIDDIKINMEQERKERLDFTKHLTVTIDGLDAKDLDDAISLTVKDNIYYLGVHIADVSHYVRQNSKLDKMAYARATSVYLADRVIPMLPHVLSNDWCSLNPDEEKLTLSCLMKLDENGHIIDHEIHKSIIISDRRMNYDEVNQFINEDKPLGNKEIEDMIIHMNELSQKLKVLRRKRGEIEFESRELGFKVDEDGRVTDIYERITQDAEQLIESFMLAANETVAEHMYHVELPTLYRIHEKPDVGKLQMALQSISKLGFKFDHKNISDPHTLQKITKQTAETRIGPIVHMLLLRSMQKAKYSHQLDIHFGLGAKYYTHFTSPIRRYPDLMLHRLIHLFVLNESKQYQKDLGFYEQMMDTVANHTSDQERKAIQLERDVAKLKSCEYMQNQIDEEFPATITQMMPSGMFVTLDKGIEGFVPLRLLNDYYHYNENYLMFVGRKGQRYKLGDMIKVRLVSVDMIERKMDFDIVEKQKKVKHENHRTK